jgi:class 3 adenylate cyclase/DNA-binding NarL/FixJ family response regulator
MSTTGRVLVVDDTEFNRRLLVRLLGSIGHESVEAVDGNEALRILRDPDAGPIDVVLLDIVMPGLDGYQTLEALKADDRLREIPVIVISGVDELDSVVRCIRAGATDYLPKTVDPAILRARIEASLAQKRLRDLERSTLEQQVAVNEVLRIMSRSAFDLHVVLDSLVAAATRLCAADYGVAYVAEDGVFRVVASAGGPKALDEYERSHPIRAGRDTLVGRVALTGDLAHIDDVLGDAEYTGTAGRDVGGYRTLLGVPILQDGEVAGVLALTRNEVSPFDAGAVRLATAFADQAAIGIGNARLLETIERQRTQLARFLSPQVAALVSSRDGEQLLAGHRREITAVFCDLRNFTVFSETAEPEEVLGFLRAYHAAMGRIVVEHEGTLEHFAGDGFMTFFNDPVLQPDHAIRAVAMAIAMRERFEELAGDWRKRGHDLEIGIGIATGYATLGRIGFEGRYDYGAIGNAIIMASRLSSEARPGQILIAPRTLASAEAAADGEVFEAESVGQLKLKGFSRSVEIHAVLGLTPSSDRPAASA